MKKLILILTSALLTFPSCASYKNVTFSGCFPEDKDEITLKQKIENYIEPDSLYNKSKLTDKDINYRNRHDPDYIEFKFNFWEF